MAKKKTKPQAKAKPQAKGASNGKTKAKVKAKAKAKTPAKKKVSFVGPGYRTVSVGLNLSDARATLAFCKAVFGAKVSQVVETPSGKLMHAIITIGDSTIMVSDAVRDPVRTAALCVYVPSVDKAVAKAASAGATVHMPPTNMLWGDRVARMTDSQGVLWHVATHVEDVSVGEIKKRAAAMAQQAQAAGAPQPTAAASPAEQPN